MLADYVDTPKMQEEVGNWSQRQTKIDEKMGQLVNDFSDISTTFRNPDTELRGNTLDLTKPKEKFEEFSKVEP